MDWIRIGTDVLNLGGALKGLFGGGVDAGSARHVQLMEAMQTISEQVARLDALVRSEFQEQRERQEATFAVAAATYQLVRQNAGEQGLYPCLLVQGEIERQRAISRDDFVALLVSSQLNDAAKEHVACAQWLMKGSTLLVGDKSPVALLTLSDEAVSQYAKPDDPEGAIKQLRQSIELNKTIHSALLDLHRYGTDGRGGIGLLLDPPNSLPKLAELNLVGQLSKAPKKRSGLQEQVARLAGGNALQVGDLADLLSQPINGELVARLLHVAAHIRNVQESLQWKDLSVEGPFRRGAYVIHSNDVRRDNRWLLRPSVLAYGLIAQEVMYRGDLVVPLVSELLSRGEQPETCNTEKLQPQSGDLCARFGRERLRTLTERARDVVGLLPHIRANVLRWRVFEQLRNSQGDPTAAATYVRYGIALQSERNDERLRSLAPRIESFWLSKTADEDELRSDFLEEHRWVSRVSGKCGGFNALSTNGKVSCSGACWGVKIRQLAPGRPWELVPERWEFSEASKPPSKDYCVVAPLPTQPEAESQQLVGTSSFATNVPVAMSFLLTAAYHLDLNKRAEDAWSRTDDARRRALSDLAIGAAMLRPPKVPLMSSAALSN